MEALDRVLSYHTRPACGAAVSKRQEAISPQVAQATSMLAAALSSGAPAASSASTSAVAPAASAAASASSGAVVHIKGGAAELQALLASVGDAVVVVDWNAPWYALPRCIQTPTHIRIHTHTLPVSHSHTLPHAHHVRRAEGGGAASCKICLFSA